MESRIVKWAIGKWKISEDHFAQDVRDSFELLNHSCAQPSAKLPGNPIRHLRNVLAGYPRNAGLGIDQQVLYLWSKLPDEALKGLLLIIRAILDGKCPLQILITLIGFLGKQGEGERPIWAYSHVTPLGHETVQGYHW